MYFSQPEVTMQIMWNRTMYVTELVALLEPDESGEVIYSGFLTTAKQHCPSVKVNSTGHIYLEASPGLVAKPGKDHSAFNFLLHRKDHGVLYTDCNMSV